MPKLKGEQLEKIAYHLFCAAGTPDDYSRFVAHHLADNNLTGHDSHGFIRVIQYMRQIKEGVIIPAARPVIVSESPGTAQVDGQRSFGQVAARFSAELGIRKAKEQGVSCVTVRRLSHLGRLGAYGEMATQAGCASIMCCSTCGFSPFVAPYGGAGRSHGTNPFAMAFPSAEEGPILSDFATSVAAEGKVRVYRARKHKLPESWVLDKEGRPSDDPEDFYAGGALLPLGASAGHKGYCLAFMADLFGAVLSRDGFPGHPGAQFSNGAFMVIIDLERFAPLATLRAEASKLVAHEKSGPLARGFEKVLYPGEKEANTRKERGAKGVDIEDDTWNQVMALVKEYKLEGKVGTLP